MPRWPSDWLGLSPEASHTARVAGSHRTNGFGFSNTVELLVSGSFHPCGHAVLLPSNCMPMSCFVRVWRTRSTCAIHWSS
ncbi:hypothetical protein BRN31_20545 [Xanthomonas oryzae pv. oryzae]|nr:hypothetical protein BRN31_20545 [Xanthomonas oryzae pv. oryzae]